MVEATPGYPHSPRNVFNPLVREAFVIDALNAQNDADLVRFGEKDLVIQKAVRPEQGMERAAFKNIGYHEIYRELDKGRSFNFKMLDGALLTFRYRFQSGAICEHSLCYFPSPDLEHFQNDSELYLLDEVYADVVARNIIPFPVRFDFNSDESRFVEIHHPYCRLTLGQYENCRIPVCSPLGPLTFGAFILRNFYNNSFRKYSDEIPTLPPLFSNTLTARERAVTHVVLGA